MELLKKLVFDLLKLYKNFIHWNTSKLLSVIFSFLVAIAFVLPIAVFLVICWFVDSINWLSMFSSMSYTWAASTSFLSIFMSHPVYVLFLMFVFLIWVVAYLTAIYYNMMNLFNLYLWYTKWEKIGFLSNVYFDFRKIFRFFVLNVLSTLSIFAPIVIFLIITLIIVLAFGWSQSTINYLNSSNWFNPLNILVVILWIAVVISTIYIWYRITFSYMIMLDEEYDKKPILQSYIASYKITKWLVFFKVMLLSLWFAVILYILNLILNWIFNLFVIDLFWVSSSYFETNNALALFMDSILAGNLLISLFLFLFYFLYFISLYWVTEMFFVSIYKNIFYQRLLDLNLKQEVVQENDLNKQDEEEFLENEQLEWKEQETKDEEKTSEKK